MLSSSNFVEIESVIVITKRKGQKLMKRGPDWPNFKKCQSELGGRRTNERAYLSFNLNRRQTERWGIVKKTLFFGM